MPALNIYTVKRHDDVGYDETRAAVVIAANPDDARQMAQTTDGDQRPSVWYLPTTKVELVGRAAPLLAGQVILTMGY